MGERGQAIFRVVMTELNGRNEPYFCPWFLGDKFPTFDYLLQLVDHPGYYFFVQVKTTTQGMTTSSAKLKVQVSRTDADRMVAWQAPSYIVGIDEPSKTGYLLSVNEQRDHVPSLITTHKIDGEVLSRLASEVHRYWASRDMVLRNSQFKE